MADEHLEDLTRIGEVFARKEIRKKEQAFSIGPIVLAELLGFLEQQVDSVSSVNWQRVSPDCPNGVYLKRQFKTDNLNPLTFSLW